MRVSVIFFFFNDTATTEIYTLSLHDALPILCAAARVRDRSARSHDGILRLRVPGVRAGARQDRKSTRLNSSHSQISYAVFCLKKKKTRTSTSSVYPPKTERRSGTCCITTQRN